MAGCLVWSEEEPPSVSAEADGLALQPELIQEQTLFISYVSVSARVQGRPRHLQKLVNTQVRISKGQKSCLLPTGSGGRVLVGNLVM